MGCENFDLVKTLRFFGGLSGAVVSILGIWQLATSALQPKTTINGCYQVLFGLLAITAELRLEQVLVHFKFLTHFLGLGLFYIFIGGLALGGSWYNILVAVILLAVGILYTSLGLCCKKFGDESFDNNNSTNTKGQGGEKEPINNAPDSEAPYQPPSLHNRPISSSNSDIHGPSSRSPWEQPGSSPYTSLPINDGPESALPVRSAKDTGAWGNDGWNNAHSEGDVNFPRAIVGAAVANPQQTVAIASAVANNPISRSAAQAAWSTARSGGNEDQIKQSAMESAIRQSNPFAEQR